MTEPIFTVGHGTRTIDELVHILRGARIVTLIDVRRFPGSKRHPHFARESFERSIPTAGVAYEWWGEELGGRRSRAKDTPTRHPAWRNAAFQAYADYMDTPAFRDAIVRLENASTEPTRVAVMCAETLWWRCHRRLIADALVMRGRAVVHLLGAAKEQGHVLNPAARAGDEGFPIYDVGATASLEL